MEVALQALGTAQTSEKLTLKDEVFACPFKEALVHQVVSAYLAGRRAGTHQQKNRADVRGGGRKPWRQKGTGNARAGTRSSPIWRSGGVTFAARPRDYSQKVNRKMYSGALRAILSELLRQQRLHVVADLTVSSAKTKDLVTLLKPLNLKHVLIVTGQLDSNLLLSARNLPHVQVLTVNQVNPVDLVRFEHVLINKPALQQLEERLA